MFQSKIRYGAAVYLKPVFEEEELKTEYLPSETRQLQTVQNDMIRAICGYRRTQHVNMKKVRTKYKLMSVNQISLYHTILEVYNVINKSSSDQLKEKFMPEKPKAYTLRSQTEEKVKVPKKPAIKCTGFSYMGPKVWNHLPMEVRILKTDEAFKEAVKNWIWETIPPY